MQGVIAKCLEELVQERFGAEKWDQILEQAGLDAGTSFAGMADVPDDTVITIVRTSCDVLDLSPVEVADAFKDHWINVFAPKLYQAYYSAAKDSFLQGERLPPSEPRKHSVVH